MPVAMALWIPIVVHVLVAAGISVRVIMRKRPTGTTLAWISIVSAFPLAGALLYLVVGERYMGRRRARRIGIAQRRIDRWARSTLSTQAVAEPTPHPQARSLTHLAAHDAGFDALGGNALEVLDDPGEILDALHQAVCGARRSVFLEFYIGAPGGRVDPILEALGDAAERGVDCRLLLDALGATDLLDSPARRRAEARGVVVRESQPIGFLRRAYARFDLRNHRKSAIIDGEVAWVGSLNLIDAEHHHEDAAVRSLDSMVRVRGPVVQVLGACFLSDWALESEDESLSREALSEMLPEVPTAGETSVQVVATGPAESPERLLQLIVSLIHGAESSVVICTPYYIPDEPVQTALHAAASKGVEVHLLVPRKGDHRLVQWVGESFYDELLDAGVHVHRHDKGFLHTKAIVVDDALALYGSMNLDMRSLWLNFELALLIQGPDGVAPIRALLDRYREDAHPLDIESWRRRGFWPRLLENVLRLLAPLL